MTETLAGVSSSKTEDLLEEPSFAEAAVGGVRKAEPDAPPDLGDVAEPSRDQVWEATLEDRTSETETDYSSGVWFPAHSG